MDVCLFVITVFNYMLTLERHILILPALQLYEQQSDNAVDLIW